MSRNESRLGTIHEAPPASRSSDAALPDPTEIVDLPSEGQFYAEGHPLHGKTSVEIRFMTAREEDILSNTTYLKKGIAYDKLLESVLVDRVRVEDLLVCDKQAILLKCRIMAYGSEYVVSIPCPSCGRAGKKHEFDLSELGNLETNPAAPVVHLGENKFEVLLPNSKQTVTIKLLTGRDEIELAKKLQDRATKKDEASTSATDLYRAIICGVGGLEDKITVFSFINRMPAMDGRFLKAVLKQITPGVDFNVPYECTSCDTVSQVPLPITAEFFFPG